MLTPEFHLFLEVVVATTATAKATNAVDRLVAVPATALGLQCHQHACITRFGRSWRWLVELLVEMRFDHDVLLNFADRLGGTINHHGHNYIYDNYLSCVESSLRYGIFSSLGQKACEPTQPH